jgi:hypothetical protein
VINDIETRDPGRAELPDIRAAVAQANREARALRGRSVKLHGLLILSHRIQIEDEQGET